MEPVLLMKVKEVEEEDSGEEAEDVAIIEEEEAEEEGSEVKDLEEGKEVIEEEVEVVEVEEVGAEEGRRVVVKAIVKGKVTMEILIMKKEIINRVHNGRPLHLLHHQKICKDHHFKFL